MLILWASTQPTCALHQAGEASEALGVTVGNSRCRRCAERVCVERQRLQRLQQPERRRLWIENSKDGCEALCGVCGAAPGTCPH